MAIIMKESLFGKIDYKAQNGAFGMSLQKRASMYAFAKIPFPELLINNYSLLINNYPPPPPPQRGG